MNQNPPQPVIDTALPEPGEDRLAEVPGRGIRWTITHVKRAEVTPQQIRDRLAALMPSQRELRDLAADHAPPPQWWDQQDDPFND